MAIDILQSFEAERAKMVRPVLGPNPPFFFLPHRASCFRFPPQYTRIEKTLCETLDKLQREEVETSKVN